MRRNVTRLDQSPAQVLSGVVLVNPEGLDTNWFPVLSLQEVGQEGIQISEARNGKILSQTQNLRTTILDIIITIIFIEETFHVHVVFEKDLKD